MTMVIRHCFKTRSKGVVLETKCTRNESNCSGGEESCTAVCIPNLKRLIVAFDNRTKARTGIKCPGAFKKGLVCYQFTHLCTKLEIAVPQATRNQDNKMPKSFLIKNCAPKERQNEVPTQPLDFQILPLYGQDHVPGVHAGRLDIPHGYNNYQGIQRFCVAPTFTWVPAMPLSSPLHPNGPFYPNRNLPVFNINDNTHFPKQEPWQYSSPMYRMEEGRKLVGERGGRQPALTSIDGLSYASYQRSTEQDQFLSRIPLSSTAVERGQVIILPTTYLGNAGTLDRRHDSALASQQATHLPLGSSQFPAAVNGHCKRKRQSPILVKGEPRQPREKKDIESCPRLHSGPSVGHNNKDNSQIPTVLENHGVRFTTGDDNVGKLVNDKKADTGLLKSTDKRNIEGRRIARSKSDENEIKSREVAKELASEHNKQPSVINDEFTSNVEQTSAEHGDGKDTVAQTTANSRSSSSSGLQGVTKRTEKALAKAKAKHRCDVCGQTFTRSSTLTTHRRIHTGEKPFSCEQCGRAFRQLGNLSRHRLTHTTSKPYVCPHCDKAFNRASNLHTHMRTHSDYKPFTCEFCDKRFHQKIDMRIHRYTHTGEKPHKCSKCGRGFKQLTHLTYHLRTHSKERLYKCEVCGKGFNQKGNLKAHVYRHTGERPFKCEVCSKGFTLASTLNTHKRIHAETKPFQCQFCDKAFYQKNALKTHYVASHPYTGGVLLL